MTIKRLLDEKTRKQIKKIKNLKNKKVEDLTSSDIKIIVGYLATKAGILQGD